MMANFKSLLIVGVFIFVIAAGISAQNTDAEVEPEQEADLATENLVRESGRSTNGGRRGGGFMSRNGGEGYGRRGFGGRDGSLQSGGESNPRGFNDGNRGGGGIMSGRRGFGRPQSSGGFNAGSQSRGGGSRRGYNGGFNAGSQSSYGRRGGQRSGLGGRAGGSWFGGRMNTNNYFP